MRPTRLLPLLLIALAVGACSLQFPWFAQQPTPTSTRAAVKVPTAQVASAPRAQAEESSGGYRLDSGDRVRVVVSGQDALSNTYDVDAGGMIAIPSVGAMSVRGLNTIQLSSAVARRLKQKNLPEAHVAVQIETYRPFTIRGEVANPGQYPYVNNMTTETAIAIAGGLKRRDDKGAVIVNPQEGVARDPSSLPSIVQPGDTVVVTEER
jgi:polysaccharide biosynthesis/export protein